MTWHTMVLTEPDPAHAGFIRRYYALVDVSMVGTLWHWRQVDANQKPFGAVSPPFNTEDDAFDDAMKSLGGYQWE